MLLLATALALAPALGPENPPTIYNGRMNNINVAIPRLDATIEVDGMLDEAVWQNAAMLTGFSQYRPVDGMAAEDSTEVYVYYSDDAIYFGIRAFEPHGRVTASLADRDKVGSEDTIELLLDTFNDRRRAMLFGVNPFGVQEDGLWIEGGGGRGRGGTSGTGGTDGSIDLSPDYLFVSKGRLTDFGYEVELRVPFKSMRFQSTDVQTWGLQVLRRVQHSGQEQTWTATERDNASFLAQSGTLDGMVELKRGLVLDLNPEFTGHLNGAQNVLENRYSYADPEPDFGMNARWGITQNMSLSGTINPDFSQIEADVAQINYDPRTQIFYPEKRPFFLEGSENFAVPNGLIYTRAIVQPQGAAKLAGKIGNTDIGVLSAVDGDEYSWHPGEQRSNPIFNVVRLRQDIGGQSTAGIVFTDRTDGDFYNRVAGADARFVFNRIYTLFAQAAASRTVRGNQDLDWAPLWELGFGVAGRTFQLHSVFEGTHSNFRAAAGAISRPGIVHANITPRYVTYGDPEDLVQTRSAFIRFDGTWTYDRFESGEIPDDNKLHIGGVWQLRGGWRAETAAIIESFLYPEYLYRNTYVEARTPTGLDTIPYFGSGHVEAGGHGRIANYDALIRVTTPQWEKLSADLYLIGGRDDNFLEWAPAWILFSTFTADWRPSDQMRVSALYTEQRFHRYDDRSMYALSRVPRLKLEYQVSRPVFVRLVGQYVANEQDALRDAGRTNDPLLFRAPDGSYHRSSAFSQGGFGGDVLFSYQPSPGTVLFAGYGTSIVDDRAFGFDDFRRSTDGFFVKVSYLFRM